MNCFVSLETEIWVEREKIIKRIKINKSVVLGNKKIISKKQPNLNELRQTVLLKYFPLDILLSF